MEQHPVPRNISGFQFRLVGDMTLKQFGFLAGGIILGYVSYKMPLPQFISLPTGLTLLVLGIAFAFVPIQDRPLDVWVAAFIKSIYSPTQFVWYKANPAPEVLLNTYSFTTGSRSRQTVTHIDASQKLNNYLASVAPAPHQTLDENEKKQIEKMMTLFNTPTPLMQTTPKPAPVVQQPVNQPDKTNEIDGAKVSLKFKNGIEPKAADFVAKKAEVKTATPTEVNEEMVKKETEKLVHEQEILKKELQTKNMEQDKFLELERKLSELISEKEKMTQELAELKRQSTTPRMVTQNAVKPEAAAAPEISRVKSVAPTQASEMLGLPSTPTVPNIIIGVVKDNLKRFLPGIIISVKDKNGFPVRALKTNKLGQFAAATPLPAGVYLVEVEDPQKRFQFDIIEITLSGQIFMPLEINAKGVKELMRERLAKEIFA